MGVAPSKRSKARTRRKRTAWSRLTAAGTMECPQCHEPKLPHRVCPSCGYYKGREVVAKKVGIGVDTVFFAESGSEEFASEANKKLEASASEK